MTFPMSLGSTVSPRSRRSTPSLPAAYDASSSGSAPSAATGSSSRPSRSCSIRTIKSWSSGSASVGESRTSGSSCCHSLSQSCRSSPGSTTSALSPVAIPLKPPAPPLHSRAGEGAPDRLWRPRARARLEAAPEPSSRRAARRPGQSRDRAARRMPSRPRRGRRGPARPRQVAFGRPRRRGPGGAARRRRRRRATARRGHGLRAKRGRCADRGLQDLRERRHADGRRPDRGDPRRCACAMRHQGRRPRRRQGRLRLPGPALAGRRPPRGRPGGLRSAGLMLTEAGPKVLELNCRFGDPERQAILPRLSGDLLETLAAAAAGDLADDMLSVKDDAALTVVLAGRDYPERGDSGTRIDGIAEAEEKAIVFQAGTAVHGGALVTNGGRILNVTALGPTLDEARETAYEACGLISFDGVQYRRDIGARTAEIAT